MARRKSNGGSSFSVATVGLLSRNSVNRLASRGEQTSQGRGVTLGRELHRRPGRSKGSAFSEASLESGGRTAEVGGFSAGVAQAEQADRCDQEEAGFNKQFAAVEPVDGIILQARGGP